MVDPTELVFDCDECDGAFKKTIFGFDWRFQRVKFGAKGCFIDVDEFDGLGVYCSEHCMRVHFPKEMAVHGIPVPPHRPDVGPVEVCALCERPVDMTRYHLAFCLDEWEVLPGAGGGKEVWDENVAVMCNTCAPTELIRQLLPFNF
jgi:hypothetical protein